MVGTREAEPGVHADLAASTLGPTRFIRLWACKVQDLFPPFCIKFQTFSQDPRCASVSPSAGWEHNTAVTQERPEEGSRHQAQAAQWGQEHVMPCWKIAINILAVPKAGSLFFLYLTSFQPTASIVLPVCFVLQTADIPSPGAF